MKAAVGLHQPSKTRSWGKGLVGKTCSGPRFFAGLQIFWDMFLVFDSGTKICVFLGGKGKETRLQHHFVIDELIAQTIISRRCSVQNAGIPRLGV